MQVERNSLELWTRTNLMRLKENKEKTSEKDGRITENRPKNPPISNDAHFFIMQACGLLCLRAK